MSSAPNSAGPNTGRRASRSLGTRLAIWYVAVTLISYVALAAILPLTVRTWVDNDGQHAAESTLDRYRQTLESGGTDALRAMFDCKGDSKPSVAIRLRDERNVEIYSAASDDRSDRVASTINLDASNARSHQTPDGWHAAVVAASQGRQLQIVLEDDSARRVGERGRDVSLLILACGLVSAIVGAFVITRRSLRPIDDLAHATQGIIDSGDLALRVRARGTKDGLDQLAALVNRMLARNETLVRAMKESLDNVAHDLRTPLTRLRAGAELALRENEGPTRKDEALAETIEESDRILAMLTTLMDITGAETGAMKLAKRPEDLAAIAREAIDLYDLVSNERGVHLVSHLAPGVIVSVDRARVRQVCANLIDNAIKYTAAGGRVEVWVSREENDGVLAVHDTGMGMTSDEVPRVWSRLYRGDRSRTERGLGAWALAR